MNMSYCAVENTASDLRQVLNLMAEFDTIEEWVNSLNEYERDSLDSLIAYCREIASYSEEIVKAWHCEPNHTL